MLSCPTSNPLINFVEICLLFFLVIRRTHANTHTHRERERERERRTDRHANQPGGINLSTAAISQVAADDIIGSIPMTD